MAASRGCRCLVSKARRGDSSSSFSSSFPPPTPPPRFATSSPEAPPYMQQALSPPAPSSPRFILDFSAVFLRAGIASLAGGAAAASPPRQPRRPGGLLGLGRVGPRGGQGERAAPHVVPQRAEAGALEPPHVSVVTGRMLLLLLMVLSRVCSFVPMPFSVGMRAPGRGHAVF